MNDRGPVIMQEIQSWCSILEGVSSIEANPMSIMIEVTGLIRSKYFRHKIRL